MIFDQYYEIKEEVTFDISDTLLNLPDTGFLYVGK